MSKNFELNQNYYTYRDNKTIPIVFIHGVGLDRKMWSPQISYFKNYSTITYDLLGHGKTPLNKENLTIKDFTDQLINLIKYLKLDKINLVGFSIGSIIALNFAADYEEKINSLTLIATTYKRNDKQRQEVIDRVNLAKKICQSLNLLYKDGLQINILKKTHVFMMSLLKF